VRSYLVDNGDDIDPAWLEGVGTVGVTAGASAPDVLVDSVIAALAGCAPSPSRNSMACGRH
jgi:4-hydroxy-3-methylbut-2-enyl diphosphate reductase